MPLFVVVLTTDVSTESFAGRLAQFRPLQTLFPSTIMNNHHLHQHPTAPSPVQTHPSSPMPMMHPSDQHPPSPPSTRDAYGAPPPYGGYYPPYGGYYYPPPPTYGSYAPPPYGAPPPYNYSSYPSQRVNSSSKPMAEAKRRKSPNAREKEKPTVPVSSQVAEEIELERIRASEDVKVAPMRSDFHFFVDDHREKIQKEAEEELGDDASNKYLLNSNINSRLMKQWEDASEKTREEYMTREEDDRKRFMQEDEIASRHCATLTARAKSPRASEDDEMEDEGRDEKASPQRPVGPSPPKKVKMDEDAD